MESIYLKLAENRTLETERLLLRPVTLDDAEDMFETLLQQSRSKRPKKSS